MDLFLRNGSDVLALIKLRHFNDVSILFFSREEAIQRLREVGKWMNKNGVAIYNSRATKNYGDGNTWFTQNIKSGIHYALVCLPEQQPIPKEIIWRFNIPKKGTKMTLVGTGETVKWQQEGNSV